jgi:predicted outer membrane repeat protein
MPYSSWGDSVMMKVQQQRIGVLGLAMIALFAVALAGIASVDARTFSVNDPSDFGDANPGDGICNVNVVGTPVCTLRAAVEEANETVASDKIVFKCSVLNNVPIVLSDEIEIEESVVIQGSSSQKGCPIIDGGTVNNGSDDGIFEINDGVVKLQYLRLINGRDNFGDGGCVDNDDNIDVVDIKKVEFIDCEASNGEGGGIDVDADALFVTGSKFLNNEAQGDGGAINAEITSNTRISKSTFKNNTSDSDGGAIMVDDAGDATIEGSNFVGNNADNEGGAIKSESEGTVIIINSKFKNNRANEGGAMCDDGNGSFTQFNNQNKGGNLGTADFTGLQDFLCVVD